MLSEKGIGFTARELAKEPLSRDEIMRLSNGDPASLIDTRKPSFRKLGVGDKTLSADQAIDLMTKTLGHQVLPCRHLALLLGRMPLLSHVLPLR